MKTRIFYCPNCKKEKRLESKRQWCDCYEPPFEMVWHTRKEDEKINKRINNYFKGGRL